MIRFSTYFVYWRWRVISELFSNFKFSYIPIYAVRCSRTIDKHANARENMLKQKWQRTESQNWSNRTTIEDTKNWYLTKPNRERSANKLILSNTRNLTNSGTKIYCKHRKKMLKPLESSRTDTPLKSKVTVRFSVTNSLWHSSSVRSFSTCKRSKIALPSKRSKYRILSF